MATFILGKDAKIYQGTAGGELGTLAGMDNVRDVTLNLEAGEADVTTRANSGRRATALGPSTRRRQQGMDLPPHAIGQIPPPRLARQPTTILLPCSLHGASSYHGRALHRHSCQQT